jgi:hypothetical protein
MKTILTTVMNIVIILLVAAIISGGFSLYVNNTSSSGGEGGQPPAMTSADGTMPAHTEGGEGGTSIGFGLIQVLITLAKLAGITVVVLLIEKGVTLLGKRAPRATTA